VLSELLQVGLDQVRSRRDRVPERGAGRIDRDADAGVAAATHQSGIEVVVDP
jgi:hypothetical protein